MKNESIPPAAIVWGNQFTRQYWRGAKDRQEAPDYVSSIYPGPKYYGRIKGEPTQNQTALKALYLELVALNNL